MIIVRLISLDGVYHVIAHTKGGRIIHERYTIHSRAVARFRDLERG